MRVRGGGIGLKKLLGGILAICIVTAGVVLIVKFVKKVPSLVSPHFDYKEAGKDMAENVDDFVEGFVIGEEGEVEQETFISFDQVADFSRLTTSRYSYSNFFPHQVNGEEVYYISYDANVEIGIDFNDIQVVCDDSKKTIDIIIPYDQVSVTIVPGSVEYIFVDDDYNTPETMMDSLSECEADAAEEVRRDPDIMRTAAENTRFQIEAITGPIVAQFYPGYVISYQRG